MTPLPRLIRGQVGPIKFHDMNEVFRHVERDATEQVDEGVEDQEQRRTPFVAKVIELHDELDAPFGKILEWEEQQLGKKLLDDETQYLFGFYENGRDGGVDQEQGGDFDGEFINPGFLFTAPFGLMHVVQDGDGRKKYAFLPSPTMFTSKVTAVIGGPLNATYDVLSVDGIIEQSGMTPIKRWSGLNYEALSVGETCWLNATGVNGELELLALEKPVIENCNAPSPGFGDSLIGF